MNESRKGKFIVFYGVNNLGKSTQAQMLLERMHKESLPVEYLKYPLYDLEPSGPIINNYLREGNTYGLTDREFQVMNVLNRTQYNETLKEKLRSGTHIISENYMGSGIAWGAASGIDLAYLEKLNAHLYTEDIVFLFDGKRFIEAIEKGHSYETNDELTTKTQEVYRKLAQERGWHIIDANETIQNIHEKLWKHVQDMLY